MSNGPWYRLRRYMLTNIIETAYNGGLAVVCSIVSDPYSVSFRGNGKTSYALRSVAAYYHFVHGYSEKEAWQLALDSIVFTIDQLIEAVENASRKDIVIADDIGRHIGRKTGYTKAEQEFFGEIDIFRTKATGLIFTAPHIKRLPGQIILHSEYIFYISRYRITDWMSRAEMWKLKYDKSKPMREPEFIFVEEEVFPTRYPNEIHDKYVELRKIALHRRAEKYILSSRGRELEKKVMA